MYQHLVAGLDVGDVQHGLPRRERHQRQRPRLFKPQALGLERGLVFMHGNALGKRTNAQAVGPRIHGIAHRKTPHIRTHGGDHTGQVRPHAQGKGVGHQTLELALAHTDVDGVDAGGANIDQRIARAEHRLGHVATLQNLGAAVGFDEPCFQLGGS